jgi:CRP/FNR family cyclic AMP-dependent transcriptional regulator
MKSEKIAALLSRVSLFSLMTMDDLLRLAQLTQYHVFHHGHVIITEGERDGRMFIILSGKVEIIKNLGEQHEIRLRTLGPQSYFGEMALIDNLARSASVIASAETELLSLDRGNLLQAIEQYPAIAIELLQMLSQRIRAIEKNLVHTLGNLLPICAHCKKIRKTDNTWTPIEAYISDHSETEFTHGICPECAIRVHEELNNFPHT